MDNSRRRIIKGFVGAALLGLTAKKGHSFAPSPVFEDSPINIILPRDYTPPSDKTIDGYSHKLTRAALDFLETNFSQNHLPFWKKPFGEIELEKRVQNIVYWIQLAVEENRKIYPVDPSWILAQIMHESYFHEFCVSRALAMGICQFIQPTAREYNMICAGDLPEHASNLYKMSEYIVKLDVYYELRRAKRKLIRANKKLEKLELHDIMQRIESNDPEVHEDAVAWNAYLQQKNEYDERIREARDQYREYVVANIEGRDIFNEHDLRFLVGFDERVTYKKPIFAMVKMLARSLRARNGNIIAAAAGYNAGLSTTKAAGLYKPFGKIPSYDETVTYISRVLINHYEIARRI
ncbi:MAG: hypothetical protein DWQ05_09270 [Calditrichaeota bacterium]|nr:MAG: hypothetical protein DWQ05_09270 [Calditrichota bacterium]